MPDVRIESDGVRTHVFVDGTEVENAVSLSLDITTRAVPRLVIEYACYGTTEFEGKAIIQHNCPMGFAVTEDTGE